MQIDHVGPASGAVQDGPCGGVLIGSNAKIDVAVRAQALLRVQARDRPAFDQQRLDPRPAQQGRGVCNVASVKNGSEGIEAVGVLKVRCLKGGL
jgi:hypothetical protein